MRISLCFFAVGCGALDLSRSLGRQCAKPRHKERIHPKFCDFVWLLDLWYKVGSLPAEARTKRPPLLEKRYYARPSETQTEQNESLEQTKMSSPRFRTEGLPICRTRRFREPSVGLHRRVRRSGCRPYLLLSGSPLANGRRRPNTSRPELSHRIGRF